MNTLRITLVFLLGLLLAACRHPLVIRGQGDIIELNSGTRGCALEEFQADWARCTDNEVTNDEAARYSALPRPGWRFARWEGYCAAESRGKDCEIDYVKAGAEWWEEFFPDQDAAPLIAIFARDDGAPATATYIASQFGAQGGARYASLMDALFAINGSYRYTVQQASTRNDFDRNPARFQRRADSLLLAGPDSGSLVPSGGATLAGDFLTLVDTDNSDGDISASYLQAESTQAVRAAFKGTYYCGHILSNGQALFFRANMSGKGTGSMIIVSDRQNRTGFQAQIGYEVSADGTTTLDYGGARLAGSLSKDGSVFTATQISSSVQGAGICLRTSGNKRVANVAGGYYGAWLSTQPVTAVTELVLDNKGQTAEVVLRDSIGGRNYALGTNFMLVLATGQIETRDADGAVSPDGRVLFLVQTDPNRFPTLIVYVRKT
tara:strand:+ start:48718 stop:50022 length:1305 start_codon:yes stop_codon:yes gene_type:complete